MLTTEENIKRILALPKKTKEGKTPHYGFLSGDIFGIIYEDDKFVVTEDMNYGYKGSYGILFKKKKFLGFKYLKYGHSWGNINAILAKIKIRNEWDEALKKFKL